MFLYQTSVSRTKLNCAKGKVLIRLVSIYLGINHLDISFAGSIEAVVSAWSQSICQ